MRKLAWGLGVCGVFVMGATMWSSHYAARHPHSLLGRAMHGASFVAAKLSPASGFGPVLAALQKKPVAHDEVEGIPADPEPAEACLPPLTQNEVANAAPIVIPDDEPEPATPHVAGAAVETSVLTPVQHELPFDPDVEVPVAVCRAPAVMPLCRDEEECEVLPEPTVEMDDDVAGGKPIEDSTAQKVSTEMEEITAEPKPVDECREDPHHHLHHSVCPHTGRSYSCPATGAKPSCDPPKPHESQYQSPGSEESSETTLPDGSSSRTALKKMKRFKTRESVDEGCPTFPKYLGVDTLEMRPSDRQLYDYGPGPL